MTELCRTTSAAAGSPAAAPARTLIDPVPAPRWSRVRATGLDLADAFALRARAAAARRCARSPTRERAAHARRRSSRCCRPTATPTTRSRPPTPARRERLGGRYRRRHLHARRTTRSWARRSATRARSRDGDAVALAQGRQSSSRSTCWCRRAAWRSSSTPSTSRPGACGRRPRPALLSGVPVIVKPATATAGSTQRMVARCRRRRHAAGRRAVGRLRRLGGPARPAAAVRRRLFHRLARHGRGDPRAPGRRRSARVRVNIEADSLNSALLLPGRRAPARRFEPARAARSCAR